MPTLRLTQTGLGEDAWRVEVALEGEGVARRTATAEVHYASTARDEEELRWYLEDYLENPHDPAPTIARGVEERMAAVGDRLFRDVFQESEDGREVWSDAKRVLDETRIEVVT